ncbi:unknown protein [Richelia intracellularis]|nr:unknown protein [Richelia intracellularis]
MSEAQNPNYKAVNESLNAPNSPLSGHSCPFYSVIPQQQITTPQLPPASEITKNEPLTIDISVNKDTPQADWVAEPDQQKQALIDDEFQKLLELNAKLRKDNDHLYQKVEELKQALANTEEALQLHKKRSSVTESMFNQQTQEVNAAQEQIKTLFADLDKAVQNAERQKSLAENYRAHLELSQQRLAQLERECSVVQANCDEQGHRLLKSENSCRELRTRLMRQQRQTLQFKAALEKCLDAPVPTTDILDNGVTEGSALNPNCSEFASTLFPHTQPIQPWSANTESSADDLHHTWEELCLPSPDEVETDSEATSTESASWHFEPTSNSNTPTDEYSSIGNDEDDSNIVVNNTSNDHPWDEKLDRAIQALLADHNLSVLEFEAFASSESSSPLTHHVDVELGSTTSGELEEQNDTHLTTEAEEINSTLPIVENLENNPITPIVETLGASATEDYWSDIPQISALDVLENTQSDNSWNNYDEEQASPSPVVYPQRPPKGRKSLASVELPNFPSGKEPIKD